MPAYKYYTAGQNGADTRAKELLTNFSHTRPNGTKWWTAGDIDDMCQSGAENIIKVTGYTAADIVAAQMNSEGHRANIISTQYTHAVIGYYNGALVQIFIKPK